VNVEAITDAEGTFARVGEAFPGVDSSEEWWLPFNCTLIRSGELTVLVDTGLGPKPRTFVPEPEARLLEQLVPDEVDVVVHTHLHIDHVGWDGSFPNARYVVHEDDWTFFVVEQPLDERPHLQRVRALERLELVRQETEVAPGVHMFPTPGHSPGHMSVRAGDVVVLGDVVVHQLQVADPDIVYVSDIDAEAAAATRRRVLGELADAGTNVIVSHFDGVGRFERAGKGFRWAVE
jgi:glyoxylase-like metal-dependent hydrolase (beta-lactamase superfamily II)